MKKMFKAVRTAARIILIALIIILFAFNAYMFAARVAKGDKMPTVFGFGFASVGSGSMSDAVNEGDFIIIRSRKEYFTGDIITFYRDGAYITHRIISYADGSFRTKGDANDSADDFEVYEQDIVGKVVGVWRGFGNIIEFLQSPLGLFLVAGAGIILWIVPDIVRELVVRKKNARSEE